MAFDEVRFQVIWSILSSVVEEQARTLMRTAFSPVVRDSGDLSAALFDSQGRMIAQALTGTPGHVNSTAVAVPLMLNEVPQSDLNPGDHLITNDPWMTSGHLHDVTVVSPFFAEQQLIGFFACTCHQLDIGGRGQGPDASSVYEEGFAIPVMKLIRGGQVNEDLMQLLRANVRTPFESQADILSYVSSNEKSARTLLSAMKRLELEELDTVGDEIIARSRNAMEAEIAKLPNGTATNEMVLDCFGEPVSICCTVTIEDRRIAIDFGGSSPAQAKGVNLVLNYTMAYAKYGARCVVGPDIPNNSGSLSPIHVNAPAGSILNVERPWPVCARHIIGQFLPDAVLGCFSELLSEAVPAEGTSCVWGVQLRGGPEIDAAAGKTKPSSTDDGFDVLFFNSGGMGGGPGYDGHSTTAFPSGIRAMPVEVVEKSAPIIIWKKELRPRSAGRGEWRGGFGQIIEVGMRDERACALFAMFDRTEHGPRGRQGGSNGEKGSVRLKSGKSLDPKGMQIIPVGERIEFLLPGGGGYGDPKNRDPILDQLDKLSGLI